MLLNKNKTIEFLKNFAKDNNIKPKTISSSTSTKKQDWGVYFQGRSFGANNSFCGIGYNQNLVFLKFWEKKDYTNRLEFIKNIDNKNGLILEYNEESTNLTSFCKWSNLKNSEYCQIIQKYSSFEDLQNKFKKIFDLFKKFISWNNEITASDKETSDINDLTPIKSINDLERNLRKAKEKMKKKNEDIRNLIAKGHNFIFYKFDEKERFMPSRFIGYQDTSIEKHKESMNKRGGITNNAISNILGNQNPTPNGKLEKKLVTFFKNIEREKELEKRIHKFWETRISLYSTNEQQKEKLYQEAALLNKNRKTIDLSNYGKEPRTKPTKSTMQTSYYVRNPQVVADALFLANGTCQGCGAQSKNNDFSSKTFKRPDGETYLEVHHIQPLSQKGKDSLENACALCPVCHRLLHHGKTEDKEKILENIKKSREEQINKLLRKI